jgi:hypothetical protein
MKNNLADIGSLGRVNSELQWAETLENNRKRVKRHTVKRCLIKQTTLDQ